MSEALFSVPATGAVQIRAPTEEEALLSTRQAAERLGLTVWALKDWRRQSNGPAGKHLPYIRVGGQVRYRPSDIRALLARGLVPGGPRQ